MSEIEIINERSITMVETNSVINKLKKRDKDINERIKKTEEYINKMIKLNEKEIVEIKKKLDAANISRLKEKHIVKIIDTMPMDIDSLKTLFANEPITLKQEEMNKLLECLK